MLRLGLAVEVLEPLSLSEADRKECSEKLALLLCQENRNEEAAKLLKVLGYEYRLAREVLHYDLTSTPQNSMDGQKLVRTKSNVLETDALQHMRYSHCKYLYVLLGLFGIGFHVQLALGFFPKI